MTTTQLKLAREIYPDLHDGVALYRLRHPESRAVSDWTYLGSGGRVRRATCIYCREVIVTCAAAWPETKDFWQKANWHGADCAREYVRLHGKRPLTMGQMLDAVLRREARERDAAVAADPRA